MILNGFHVIDLIIEPQIWDYQRRGGGGGGYFYEAIVMAGNIREAGLLE